MLIDKGGSGAESSDRRAGSRLWHDSSLGYISLRIWISFPASNGARMDTLAIGVDVDDLRLPPKEALRRASVWVSDLSVGQKTTSNLLINSATSSGGSSPFTVAALICTSKESIPKLSAT